MIQRSDLIRNHIIHFRSLANWKRLSVNISFPERESRIEVSLPFIIAKKTAHDECVELVPDNIIAYVTSDYKFAFVLEKMLNKFISDTAEYSLSYLPVKDFMKEEFCIQTTEQTPGFFKRIVWINDDFLYDVKQDFDFNTFRLIDDGIKYLNPGHFTIYELVSYINSAEQSELI